MIITAKLDVTKIEKSKIHVGVKGKYIDIVLIEKEDGYGNHYMVVQGISKEERNAGKRGAILGKGKRFAPRATTPRPTSATNEPPDAVPPQEDDIPF